jgi:hypothetical protein
LARDAGRPSSSAGSRDPSERREQRHPRRRRGEAPLLDPWPTFTVEVTADVVDPLRDAAATGTRIARAADPTLATLQVMDGQEPAHPDLTSGDGPLDLDTPAGCG